ncbi:MAG: hypothetical protein LIP02_11310, partial [Bacteroidales bacterium]|nr:hypothetical protein [Bacteroidales bacterium]
MRRNDGKIDVAIGADQEGRLRYYLGRPSMFAEGLKSVSYFYGSINEAMDFMMVKPSGKTTIEEI